jgi:hypothetical protein
MNRNPTPSRAVIGGATVGTPLALLLAWASVRWNVGIPQDVLVASTSLLTAATSWLFRGGRRGEAE